MICLIVFSIIAIDAGIFALRKWAEENLWK